MRLYRWTVIILLLSLVLGVSPAAAEIIPIDPAQPPAPVLEPAEVEKLRTLLQWTNPGLLTEVSPDDTTVLIGHFKLGPELRGAMPALEFLDVQNGTRVPVEERVRTFPLISNVAWRDAHTAVYVSFDESDTPLLVELDRSTGRVTTTPLPLPGLPWEHRPLAPDASRLLVMLPAEGEQMSAQARKQWLVDIAARRVPGAPSNPLPAPAMRTPVQLANEELTLAVFDLTSQQLVPLGPLTEESSLKGEPAWTSDGTKLALVRGKMRPPGHLPLEHVATQDSLGQLPPTDNPFLQSNVVEVFDLTGGDIQPAVLRAATGDGWFYSEAAWSPDGQTLMTQLKRPAHLVGRPYPTYQNADRVSTRFYNSALEPIGHVKRPELGGPRWSFARWLSAEEVLFYAPAGMNWRLYSYNLVSGKFRQLPLPDGTYHEVLATRQSRQLLFVHSSFLQPYEIYHASWDGSGFQPLTQLNEHVAAVDNIRADPVAFKMKGGATRRGYLLQPADATFPPKNVPIVLWQEGGPGNPMTNQWGAMALWPFNLLPNFGIAVLVLPLPGREGYGPEFYNALVDGRNFGALDIDEAVEAVEQMIKRGWTSQGRVGLSGCSYGGYFTVQSITRHPKVYAAANAQCSLLDLLWLWNEEDTVDAAYLEGRPPTDDASGEYRKDSPLYNAARVRTPLLMFHGRNDYLPVELTIDFHNRVAATGTPVDLLIFEEEIHGLALLNSNLVAGQAQIQWFRQYLAAPATK